MHKSGDKNNENEKSEGVSGRRTIYSLSKIHLNKIGEKKSNKKLCVKTGVIIKGGELGTICRVSSRWGLESTTIVYSILNFVFCFLQNK